MSFLVKLNRCLANIFSIPAPISTLRHLGVFGQTDNHHHKEIHKYRIYTHTYTHNKSGKATTVLAAKPDIYVHTWLNIVPQLAGWRLLFVTRDIVNFHKLKIHSDHSAVTDINLIWSIDEVLEVEWRASRFPSAPAPDRSGAPFSPSFKNMSSDTDSPNSLMLCHPSFGRSTAVFPEINHYQLPSSPLLQLPLNHLSEWEQLHCVMPRMCPYIPVVGFPLKSIGAEVFWHMPNATMSGCLGEV